MKFGLAILALILATGSPAFADNYLLSTDTNGSFQVVEVFFEATEAQGGPGLKRLPLNGEKSILDFGTGMIRGITTAGAPLSVAFTNVSSIRMQPKTAVATSSVTLQLAALTSAAWPPAGRVKRAVLHSGQVIAFNIMGPGFDLENKTLFWSCETGQRVEIPFGEIFYVQLTPNRFVKDFNSMADMGVIDSLELKSGEVVEVGFLAGSWEADRRVIAVGDPAVEYPLDDVAKVLVGDCRGREAPPPVVVAEPPEVVVLEPQPDYLAGLDGSTIRLRRKDAGGDWLVGRLAHHDSQGLGLALQDDQQEFRYGQIKKLQVSEGMKTNTWKGALIGGGVGLLIGGVIFLANNPGNAASPYGLSEGEAYALVVIGNGMIAGYVVGAIIGAGTKTEHWDELKIPQTDDALGRADTSRGFGLAWKF